MNYRVSTYNIKWFTNLFDDQNQLLLTTDDSDMYQVDKKTQLESIAKVLQSLDADIYCILESPNTSQGGRNTIQALENFAQHFNLRTSQAIVGFLSDGRQEIAFLFDPAVIQITHNPQGDDIESPNINILDFLKGERVVPAPKFDSYYVLDVEEDSIEEIFKFERPPLEAQVTFMDNGQADLELEMIGVHAKSKIVTGAIDEIYTPLNSMANRRKLLAQCQWIRNRVLDLMDENKMVVVMGDFNDGPGLDFYEKQFGRSAVEIVMGNMGEIDNLLRNPFTKASWNKSRGWRPSSAKFFQFESRTSVGALLDFVMATPNLAANRQLDWIIWNPHEKKDINDSELEEALKIASDHFPVSMDIGPTLT